MISKDDINSAKGVYEEMAKDLFLDLMEEFMDSLGVESDEYVIKCSVTSEVRYVSN